MDNNSLICTFVESVVASKPVLLANATLRIEPVGNTLQLWSKTEGMIANARLGEELPWLSLKDVSSHWAFLHKTLVSQNFLPVKPSDLGGFYRYEHATVPDGYQVHFSDGLVLLQAWWQYKLRKADLTGLLGMLIWHRRAWHPIRDITCEGGLLQIKSWGNNIDYDPSQRSVWIVKDDEVEEDGADNSHSPNAQGNVISLSSSSKCIGNYLVEAGLLSPAQVEVALSDQAATGMRFGEIVVSRGWLKEQTIEYLMKYLILPQQRLAAEKFKKSQNTVTQARPALDAEQRRHLHEQSSLSVHERDTLALPTPHEELSIHERETMIMPTQLPEIPEN